MSTRTRRIAGSALAIFALALFAGPAAAQSPPPPKGFNVKELGTISLGPEIDGMQGRVLRMSYVTVEPGSAMPAHPHKDRPEIIFVVQGKITETRNGVTAEHGPGAVLLMTKDITHALENRSDAPAVYLATPIVKQP
jgi:quercetin dioxygenase-like cupin family protein